MNLLRQIEVAVVCPSCFVPVANAITPEEIANSTDAALLISHSSLIRLQMNEPGNIINSPLCLKLHLQIAGRCINA